MPRGLERYESINKGEAIAKFQLAKRFDVERDNIDDIHKAHEEYKKEFTKFIEDEGENMEVMERLPPDYSFLDLKIELLNLMLYNCNFCERRCNVNRYEKFGFCRCGVNSYYSSEFLHFGEEPELIPSHTIFFNRCTFSCVFCQNYDIVRRDDVILDVKEMARLIDIRRRQGSKNVNFVGGNPDQHAHNILAILNEVESNIPVVWNSNMYHSIELHYIIEDIVDVWLADFKYGNDNCAEKYSNVKNYWKVITRNFLLAKKSGELLIRHLVMPEHLECCTERIVKWVSDNLGRDVRFNLMFQYYPTYKAFEYPEISRRLNDREIVKAMKIAITYLNNLV